MSHPVVDEGLIAQATQPQLGFFFGFGLAQLREHLLSDLVLRHVVRTASEQLHEIVRLMLRQTTARLEAQSLSLSVSDDAVNWIATHGYEPEFGARPLRRLIQREVDDRIAGLMVESELAAGTTIEVGVVGDELLVTSNAVEPQLAA